MYIFDRIKNTGVALALKWDDVLFSVNHWMDAHPKTSLCAVMVVAIVATNLLVVEYS